MPFVAPREAGALVWPPGAGPSIVCACPMQVQGENIMHSCYQIGRVCHCFKRALHLLSPEFNDWENSETQLLAQVFGSTRYTQTSW